MAGPVQATELDLAAQIGHLEITPLANLPKNTSTATTDAFCPILVDTPKSPEGQQVTQAGWLVSGEIEVGGLTFASFAGEAEQGISGSCLLRDSNIGIFQDNALRGLFNAPQDAVSSIGSIDGLEGNTLRIWDGDYLSQPLADLMVVGEDLVILRNVASRNSFCESAVNVPNLYGLPVHLARRMLLAEGWSPERSTEEPGLPWVVDMRAD